jgi:RNA polymerase sigma-70 factor, ECF subfamily
MVGARKIPMVAEMAHVFLANAQNIPALADEEKRGDYLTILVTRAQAGDALAFERIMLATEQRVVSIAWRMLGNRDDARDAAQEVYLRVFKYLERFRAGEDLRGWLYRITINVCHDLARRKRAMTTTRLSEIDFRKESAAVEDTGTDPESRTLYQQQLALVRRALNVLSAKERAALVLRDLEGLTTEEVARALGSRPVTVRSQVSSARAKIRTYCEKLSRRGGSR